MLKVQSTGTTHTNEKCVNCDTLKTYQNHEMWWQQPKCDSCNDQGMGKNFPAHNWKCEIQNAHFKFLNCSYKILNLCGKYVTTYFKILNVNCKIQSNTEIQK